MAAPRQGSFIKLAVKDKAMLHANYMPFIKGGGVFIPTDKTFDLGDEVFLVLLLPDDPEQFAMPCKVVWINGKAMPGRSAGIGIQFSGPEGNTIQKKIDTLLAGYVRVDQPTNTM